MSVIIYTHANCPTYTHTPLQMFAHLELAHNASTTATLAAIGPRGLDSLLIKQRLHSSPYPGTRTYPCALCGLLHATSFESQAHYQHAPAHAAEVAAARAQSGDAGIAALITTAWLEPLDEHARPPPIVKNKYTNEVYVNEEQGALHIAQNAGPAAQPGLQLEITLTLDVSGYSARAHFPPRVALVAAVPRATASVDALATCLEDAWVRRGGERGKVGWAQMVRAVGVSVGAVSMRTDGQVEAWVRSAGAREDGRMAG